MAKWQVIWCSAIYIMTYFKEVKPIGLLPFSSFGHTFVNVYIQRIWISARLCKWSGQWGHFWGHFWEATISGCYLNNNRECPNHPHLCILAERTKDNLDVKVGTIPRASETRYVLFQELLWDSVSLSMKWSISTQRPLNSFAPLQNCSEVIKQLKRLPFFHFVLLNILNNGGYSLLIFFPTPHRPHIYIHISILYSFSPKVSTLYL